MPAIISDSKQQQALQQVMDGLKAVSDINTMLDIAAKDNAFTVSAKSRKKPAIVVDEQAATRIQGAIKAYRDKMVKKIRDTADKQRIALSDEDEAILNWGVGTSAAEPVEDTAKASDADEDDTADGESAEEIAEADEPTETPENANPYTLY